MTERALRAAVAALALAGAAIASYLVVVKYTDSQLVCPTSGCETVQRSRYAELLGVPVALLGLIAYLAVLASAARAGAAAAAAGAMVALGSLAFGAYLLVVQLAVIHALCLWCVASDVVVAALAAAAVARLGLARP